MNRILARAALAAALVLGLVAPAAAQDPSDPSVMKLEAALRKAMQRHEAADYAGALAAYAEAEKALEAAKLPEEARRGVAQTLHYNTACALSLTGEKEKALDRLEKAIDAGFVDLDHMAQDKDLDPLRKEPRFEAAMKKAKGAQAAEAEREKAQVVAGISKDALFEFDFDLATLDGKRVKLADFAGKVVLVDVWGTWCPPCRAEVPHLIELHKKLGPKGFSVVGLNSEQEDTDADAEKVVKEFAAKEGIPYPLALIGERFVERIPGFEGFPTLLLVDRKGRVRLKLVGYTEGAVLEAAAEKLLAEPADGGKPGGEPKPEGEKSEAF